MLPCYRLFTGAESSSGPGIAGKINAGARWRDREEKRKTMADRQSNRVAVRTNGRRNRVYKRPGYRHVLLRRCPTRIWLWRKIDGSLITEVYKILAECTRQMQVSRRLLDRGTPLSTRFSISSPLGFSFLQISADSYGLLRVPLSTRDREFQLGFLPFPDILPFYRLLWTPLATRDAKLEQIRLASRFFFGYRWFL